MDLETDTMDMDKNRVDIGYRLGRLWAVIQTIDPSLANSYNNVVACPKGQIPRLFSLVKHKTKDYDDLLTEIHSGLSAGAYPNTLDVAEQCNFFVGFYHQISALKALRLNLTEPLHLSHAVQK